MEKRVSSVRGSLDAARQGGEGRREEGAEGEGEGRERRDGYTTDGRILPAALWLLEDTNFYDY